MAQSNDKMAKIPYAVIQFDKDGTIVHEESYNMSNVYLDPYRVEAIARTILPEIQAYYQTEEGNAAYEKWQAEQEMLGINKPKTKPGKRGRKKS